jgi:hypothetical protein
MDDTAVPERFAGDRTVFDHAAYVLGKLALLHSSGSFNPR